jgi:glycosyltransferase involved in cell wall biosynthesis
VNGERISRVPSETIFGISAIKTSQQIRPLIVAGIPAYNEGHFIGEVVRAAKVFVDEVIVVDDGSTDDTAQVAKSAGALVIIHETNRGVGGATKSCFAEAKKRGARVLITLDGDGQHNPQEIPQLLAPILKGEADLVIGSRFLANHKTMPVYRRFGINVINLLYNIGSKIKISDTQSCFRAYGERALQSLDIKEDGFSFSVELLLKARHNNFVISEVPISCIYHSNSHSANPLIHGLGVALTLVKLRLVLVWSKLFHTRNQNKD